MMRQKQKMKSQQVQWLVAILLTIVAAVIVSSPDPPNKVDDKASVKAFTEVGDWIKENFGSKWFVVLGIGIGATALSIAELSSFSQWTLLAIALVSGMMLTLMVSTDGVSANEFRAWCLANAGVIVMALSYAESSPI